LQEARIEQAQIRHDFIDVHMALIEAFINYKKNKDQIARKNNNRKS
jgi:hypothetical protein